jgi:hypothetical protein
MSKSQKNAPNPAETPTTADYHELADRLHTMIVLHSACTDRRSSSGLCARRQSGHCRRRRRVDCRI